MTFERMSLQDSARHEEQYRPSPETLNIVNLGIDFYCSIRWIPKVDVSFPKR